MGIELVIIYLLGLTGGLVIATRAPQEQECYVDEMSYDEYLEITREDQKLL